MLRVPLKPRMFAIVSVLMSCIGTACYANGYGRRLHAVADLLIPTMSLPCVMEHAFSMFLLMSANGFLLATAGHHMRKEAIPIGLLLLILLSPHSITARNFPYMY